MKYKEIREEKTTKNKGKKEKKGQYMFDVAYVIEGGKERKERKERKKIKERHRK